MKNFSIFQLSLAVIFFMLAAGGLIAFVSYTGSGSAESINLTVWTDINDAELWRYVQDNQSVVERVTVQTFPKENFVETVISELSLGKFPDVLITSTANQILLGERLKHIPYESLPQSQFTSEYISGALVPYTSIKESGFNGLPLAVDPLLLYSNSNLLNENGIIRPPEFWDEMSQIVNQYAKRDGSIVSQVILPIGTARNVAHAPEVFYSLLGQINAQPLYYQNGTRKTDLREKDPARMIGYYTDFANTNTGVYNWNASYESDRKTFAANDSYFYIDYASQRDLIQSENPNIVVMPTELPQIRGNSKYVHANYYGAYFPQAAKTTSIAVALITDITRQEGFVDALNQAGLVSASRAGIDPRDQDQLISAASKSALYSGTTLIRDYRAANNAFVELIQDILSRGINPNRAMQDYATDILEI